MPEHLIRLRGGWEWHDLGDAPPTPGRVSLPLVWPDRAAPRVRLARSFQRPPLDPARETLGLRLEAVAGLVWAKLNDRAPARPEPDADTLWLPIDDPLPPRNVLVLEVEPGATGTGPWGLVTLVIRPRAAREAEQSLGERGVSL